MFQQSYAIISVNKWARLQMLLDIYEMLITDNRNQYNVTNVCKADDVQTNSKVWNIFTNLE